MYFKMTLAMYYFNSRRDYNRIHIQYLIWDIILGTADMEIIIAKTLMFLPLVVFSVK